MKDQVAEAEAQLNKEARTAGLLPCAVKLSTGRAISARPATLYRQALKMDPKTARAHFGLGKLAMAKLKDKEAVQEIARAIELEPTEPLYRLYASEAYALQKNYAEQMKQLQEYIRMNPNDPDRLAEAKAGLRCASRAGCEGHWCRGCARKSSTDPTFANRLI